eukprot:6473032-Amphidinium_carterae.1
MDHAWQHYYQHYQFDQWVPHRTTTHISTAEDSLLYQAQTDRTKQWDILELFGGFGTCTSLAVRKNMAAGGNIDILRGVDAANPRTRYEVAQAVRLYKPVVLVTGPP